MDEFSDQIGGRLTEAREAAGLSVDDVIFRTRIPRGVITALEAGDFTFFSSPTYAKSFLGQYSEFLDVEAGQWLDALKPAYFIADETASPLWQMSEPRKEIRVRDPAHSSGWLSSLGFLVLTGGIALAAYKGYEFFEKRFEAEVDEIVNPGAEAKGRSATPPPARELSLTVEKEPVMSVEQAVENPAQRPPRALIVR
ncbi:helix-turn-helix domain-containing protein [Luteolibacter yonseiensis]|uniref:Helix-turn-helix domain-containing protein n=1 Tax=Luteolibacter yonseiensis TaxID=1144680 RepID=A0A934V8G0_9BACT|nr:helix-turn-helix domain-containing protein [Luteolibacter yonseiensis]MBK1817222.1 helix-turn-helix domain-containing protein [Luteolibacter yonseiensis]